MDLNKLKTFKCVADLGKINLASAHLKIAASAISVAISALEADMGCQLFTRHFKGMKLTPNGEKLYNLSKKMLWDIECFLKELKEKEKENNFVKGLLTIATTQGIASSDWFNKNLFILLEKFPELSIDIIDYKENEIDFIAADVFFCPFVYNHLDLVQEKIGDACFKLFASKNYVEKFGLPEKPEDLDNHRLIGFSKELQNPFNEADSLLNIGREDYNPRNVFLHVNNSIGLLKLIKKGLGIGSLHVSDVLNHKLIPLFGDKEEIVTPIYLVYRKRDKTLKNITAFSEVFLSTGFF